MALQIQYNLSAQNGFHYQTANQAGVGFITTLSVGNLILTPDISVTLPTGQVTNVVSVLTGFAWGGGVGDALSFTGRLSDENNTAVETMIHQGISTGTPTECNFLIFQYDATTKVWYQGLAPVNDAPLGALLTFNGQQPQLTGSSSAATDVTNPMNYLFTLEVSPQPYAQSLKYAGSPSVSSSKQWGLNTGGGGPSGPSAQTDAGPRLSGATAALPGSVSSSFAAQAFFEYGTDPALSSYNTSPPILIDYGSSSAGLSFTTPNLNFATTYYYRVLASNAFGTSVGSILSFKTLSTEVILTNATASKTGYLFGFTNAPNAAFSVHASSSLATPASAWPVIGSATEASPGQYYFSKGTLNSNAQFYRVSSP